MSPKNDRNTRLPARLLPEASANRWTILDPAWAKALGVRRDRGRYRIRSRELLRRLHPAPEPLAVPGLWTINPEESRMALLSGESGNLAGYQPVTGAVSTGRDAAGSWLELAAGPRGPAGGEDLRFRSTSLHRRSARSAVLCGDVTVAGQTRPVSLDLSYLGPSYERPAEVALSGRARLDAAAFGLEGRASQGGLELWVDARAVPAAA